jgi:D-alanyl-lipoteichoic acid acyltransferase DltB (MBOAT superfamily)
MLFNSFSFLVFFVVVSVSFYVLKHRFRWLLLLLASCIFYMFFKPAYILILAFTIVVDYYAGIAIENAGTQKKKYAFLVASLIANIGVLAVFKYYNFINDNITGLCRLMGVENQLPYLHILLPIGLSFHTFQAMSYTIEIYRGHQQAERHFGLYALYVMFYPQLVAGPIERPQNLLHQFRQKNTYQYHHVVTGLRLMLWGFFKKIVIADRLGVIVNEIYANHNSYTGVALLVAVIFFAFQIYADFSGYSDIAVGAAKVMGFDLMLNFHYPFRSKNFTEFWRRWHISLSTWFNDYLYTPISFSKRKWRNYAVVFAIMITFSISGLWHGAGWTFLVFGLLHGAVLSYEAVSKKFRKRLAKKIPALLYNRGSQLLTFAFLAFTWIFFRSETFPKAFDIIKNIFTPGDSYKKLFDPRLSYHLVLGIGAIFLMETLQGWFKEQQFHQYIEKKSTAVRWAFYLFFCILILNFGYYGSNQFIYFQF